MTADHLLIPQAPWTATQWRLWCPSPWGGRDHRGKAPWSIAQAAGSLSLSAACEVTAAFNLTMIYGATWDGSATTKLVRTDDAALFVDPSPAVGDGPGSSPFDNIMPWSGMVRVTQDGNELAAVPKYWVKVSHNPFGERDIVYIGRYECDGSYMSRSGHAAKASAPLATFRSGIAALGAEYWQADFALQLTWWFLYIVEFADWNGQTAVGQGSVSSFAAITTRATDSMTYYTGRAAGTDGQTAVQYRWIENPWGNGREWRDGIIFSDQPIQITDPVVAFVREQQDKRSTYECIIGDKLRQVQEGGFYYEWYEVENVLVETDHTGQEGWEPESVPGL